MQTPLIGLIASFIQRGNDVVNPFVVVSRQLMPVFVLWYNCHIESKTKGNTMKLLIAPRSPMPIRIKALIRWMIVMWVTKIRNRRFHLHEYDDGVPTWKGWLEWRGMAVCFVDNDDGDHYRW